VRVRKEVGVGVREEVVVEADLGTMLIEATDSNCSESCTINGVERCTQSV
jgi:hypothetical protein